jgi:hypothetical protein
MLPDHPPQPFGLSLSKPVREKIDSSASSRAEFVVKAVLGV